MGTASPEKRELKKQGRAPILGTRPCRLMGYRQRCELLVLFALFAQHCGSMMPWYRPLADAFPALAPHPFGHCAAKSRAYLCELRKLEKMY